MYSLCNEDDNDYNKMISKNKKIIEQTADVCKELENYLNELSNLSSHAKKIK